jgi:hypothetical protein
VDPAAIHLEAWVVALIAGTLTPIATGLLTKLSAQPGMKAFVAFLLTATIAVFDAIVVAGGQFIVRDTIILFVTTFAWHAATYFNVWKPLGGGAAPGAKATAEIGLG